MKLGISNIAWDPVNDLEVRNLLVKYGFQGIELAPTKYWPDCRMVDKNQISEVANFWAEKALRIPSFQSLLYGFPTLKLFESARALTETIDYLGSVFKIARQVGAKQMVFGAPKNRLLPDQVSLASHSEMIVGVFRKIGDLAQQYSVNLCLEAVPAQYGSNFLTSFGEVEKLVNQVQHPNICIHFDLGASSLESRPIGLREKIHASNIQHVHLSKPGLAAITGEDLDIVSHALVEFESRNYEGWYVIEMLSTILIADQIKIVEAALSTVAEARDLAKKRILRVPKY